MRHNILWDFEIEADCLHPAGRPDNYDKQKTENLPSGGFTVSVDHSMKIKELEKGEKYFDLARELKKLCNMS